MDALILSCGTGGGHNSAGKAILQELERRGHHAEMLNPYTLRSERLSEKIDSTYISTVQHVPDVFGAAYKLGDLYRHLPFRSPVYSVNRGMNHVMEEYFRENPANIVIMPHLFPAEIMTNMKLHGSRIPKTMFIATDYVCIPFTEETICDAYVIPAEDLSRDFTGRGIPKGKLYPLGIPVNSSFTRGETRGQARTALGLDQSKKYVLVAGGSMGGGGIEKVIDRLIADLSRREDIGLILLCGSNEKLFEKLSRQALPGVTVLKSTDRMATYLRASDLFVTKPGGLSSTEAAVCNTPILHIAAIPGCESFNADYFGDHGMSVSCDLKDNLTGRVLELLENAKLAEEMIDCQKKTIHPNAAADICDLAEAMIG
ncbi:MAG: glycosyltransferase [Acetatifactor sp.]